MRKANVLYAKGDKDHGQANRLGAAIAGEIEVHGHVKVQCIGAFAVNNAVKAISIAETIMRGVPGMEKVELACRPGYVHKTIRGTDTVLMELYCFKKREEKKKDFKGKRRERREYGYKTYW